MTGSRELYASAAIHRAVVNVNEEGTEAAAASGIIMVPREFPFPPSPPKQLVCDHPVQVSGFFQPVIHYINAYHHLWDFINVFVSKCNSIQLF